MSWDRILMLSMGGFIALMIFFYIGFTASRQSLVVERPYEAALTHDARQQARRNAQQTGRTLSAAFDAAGSHLVVRIGGCHPQAVVGHLRLLRPADEQADRRFPLQLNDSLVQYVTARDLKPGRWLLEAEWTEGDSSFFAQTSFYH
jgi:nitrogen fixation protein FixH